MENASKGIATGLIVAVIGGIIGLIIEYHSGYFNIFIGKQDNTEKELKQYNMEKELREAKAEAEREKAKRIEAEKRKETSVDYTATPAGQFPKELEKLRTELLPPAAVIPTADTTTTLAKPLRVVWDNQYFVARDGHVIFVFDYGMVITCCEARDNPKKWQALRKGACTIFPDSTLGYREVAIKWGMDLFRITE